MSLPLLLLLLLLGPAQPASADPPIAYPFTRYTADCSGQMRFSAQTDTGSPRMEMTFQDREQGLQLVPRSLNPSLLGTTADWNFDSGIAGSSGGGANDVSNSAVGGANVTEWNVCIDNVSTCGQDPSILPYTADATGNGRVLGSRSGQVVYQDTRYGNLSGDNGVDWGCPNEITWTTNRADVVAGNDIDISAFSNACPAPNRWWKDTNGSATWNFQGAETSANLKGIWAFAGNEIWAVGDSATIRRYNGNSWFNTEPCPGVIQNLNAVWGLPGVCGGSPTSPCSASKVWAVGNSGKVCYTESLGGSWTVATTPGGGNLQAIHGRAANDVWAVDGNSRVLHFDGAGWTTVTLLGFLNPSGVFEADATNVYVVFSSTGVIAHYPVGGALNYISVPFSDGHNAITGTSATSMWAVGRDRVVTFFNGVTPVQQFGKSPGEDLTGVFALDADSVFAVSAAIPTANVYRYNGASWSAIGTALTPNSLRGVTALTDTAVWAVGDVGGILHYGPQCTRPDPLAHIFKTITISGAVRVLCDSQSDGYSMRIYDRFLADLPGYSTVAGRTGIGFDASKQHYMVYAPGALMPASAGFSMQAWVRVNAVNSGLNTIMGQGWDFRQAYLGVDPFNHRYYFWVGDPATNQVQFVYSSDTVENLGGLGSWHLLAGTYGNGRARLYVDGILHGEAVINAAIGTNTNFYVGRNYSGDYFTGQVDDARVVPRELSEQEVAADYNPVAFRYAVGSSAGPWTYLFGPDPNAVFFPNASPGNGTTDVLAVRTKPLPFRYGTDNFAQFIMQNTLGETGTSETFVITVSTLTPDPPFQLAGRGASASSINWTWSDPYLCLPHSYELLPVGGSPVSQGDTHAWTETGLSPNTAYGLQARAVTMYGTSALSPNSTAYTLAAAPVALSTTAVYFSSMSFSWSANQNPSYTPYELSYSSNDPAFATGVSTPVPFGPLHTATTAGVSGLSPATTYYFRVRAQNGNGEYPGGGVASAFNYQSGDTLRPIATLPRPPAGLTAAGVSTDSVRWTWEPISTAQRYRLLAPNAELRCDWTPLAFDWKSDSGSCGTLGNTPLGPNQRAGMRVQTENLSGLSEPSAAVYAFTLAQTPENLRIVSSASNTVTLAWDAPDNPGYTTYQLAASLDPSFPPNATSTMTMAALSAVFPDLLPGASYFFQVRALNGDGRATALVAPGGNAQTTLSEGQSRSALPPSGASTLLATDGRTRVEVPAGALPAGATVYVSVDPVNEPVTADRARLTRALTLAPQGLAYVPTSAREVTAVVGGRVSTATFAAPVTLYLPYSDGIHPGVVDDSDPPIQVGSLKAYTLNPFLDQWESLPSALDADNKRLRASTQHFSVFALFGQPLPAVADLEQMKVYPQPWRPGSGGSFDSASKGGLSGLVFDALPSGARVKIFTLAGEPVATLNVVSTGAGFAAVWDGRNAGGRRVASAVYLARIEGAGKKKLRKIAIER